MEGKTMLKHVLVPLDGSKLAEEALNSAMEIVAGHGRISLVTAVEDPEAPAYGYLAPVTPPNNDELLSIARHYLERIALDHTNDDVTFDYRAIHGDPSTVITEEAKRLQVDVIVMSTHGRSGISRLLLGSVTSKVLASKICSVFVVFNKETVPLETAKIPIQNPN